MKQIKAIKNKSKNPSSSKKKSEKKSKNTKDKNDVVSYNIFESPLDYAVACTMYPDRVPIPRIVRDCILYVEKNGLTSQGVYRLSGTSSKIDRLKQIYDSLIAVDLEEEDTDVNVVACLLKLYFRRLPNSMIIEALMPEFECVLSSQGGRDMDYILNSFENILSRLPLCNRVTLGWLCVHLHNLLEHADQTLMTEQNIIIVFVPCLRIQPPLFLVFIKFSSRFFPDCFIKKYTLQSEVSEYKINTNLFSEDIERHMAIKENTVNKLQSSISQFSTKLRIVDHFCSVLWETQRQITELKRLLRHNRKQTALADQGDSIDSTLIDDFADVNEVTDTFGEASIHVSNIESTNQDELISSELNEITNTNTGVSTQTSDIFNEIFMEDRNTQETLSFPLPNDTGDEDEESGGDSSFSEDSFEHNLTEDFPQPPEDVQDENEISKHDLTPNSSSITSENDENEILERIKNKKSLDSQE